ncbi:MAG: hypothetical protein RLY93_15800 [Sumerlaeia bacterium]
MRRALPTLIVTVAAATLLGGCSWYSTNRCYVPEDKYEPMRDLFLATGSMQRVDQAMDDLKYAGCEKRQIRYWIEKDLYLEDLTEGLDEGSRAGGS